MLTEWKLVSFIASCSSLIFPFILLSWISFIKALLSFPLEMLIFRNQKSSSLWLHEKFLIDYWMYYTACPFSLAEQWQICLREGENPMPYLHRGLVQAMSEGAGKGIFWPWFDHPNSPCSDSVDFLSFNFTASFAVSRPPALWPFLATLPIVGISITTCQMLQTGGCVLTIPYFQSLEVFTLPYTRERAPCIP